MKASLMSSVTLWNAPRTNVSKLQAEIARSSVELTTGRSADVGMRLGSRTGDAFSVRNEIGYLTAIKDGNAAVRTRIDGANLSLDGMRASVDSLQAMVISLAPNDRNIQSMVDGARMSLDTFIGHLNRPMNGQYVFGGTNTGQKPIAEYTDDSPAKIAVQDAFAAHFGFSATDPAVAGITPADIDAFISGPFTTLFEGPSWTANWSNASDTPVTSRISETEMAATSVSANDASFRAAAMGFSMILDMGIGLMSDASRAHLLGHVTATLADGSGKITDAQANLGTTKNKMSSADELIDAKNAIYVEQLADMEGVDPVEAKMKIDQLTTQLQASFALTAQLRGMNLINHL